MMELQKAVKTSLVDTVVDRLRDTIEKGRLRRGDRLPSEQELIRQLGVSRLVLRQAMGRLQSVGMLKVVHGRGIFVADRDAVVGCSRLLRTILSISSTELIQFMELRTAIECRAARLVAQTTSPQAVAELEESLQQVRAAGFGTDEGRRRDLRFHLKIVELAGNTLMVDVLKVIQELMVEAMARTLAKPDERRWAEEMHLAIVDAIRAGDPAAAEAAVRHHMEELCKRLETAGKAECGSARIA